MDAGPDTQAGPPSTKVADGLRDRNPDVMRSFLRSWGGAAFRYCRMVCQPELVAEAVELTFDDFFEKLETHPIDDAHLDAALTRSTRLTAAEAAKIEWDEPGGRDDGEPEQFDCALTPLLLAGSPSAAASLSVLARMDTHVPGCRRCQGSARRFAAAEKSLSESKGVGIRDDVLGGLLQRYMREDPEARNHSEPEVLVTIQLRFPRLDPVALGEHLAPVLAATLKTGGISTTLSMQPYDPDDEAS